VRTCGACAHFQPAKDAAIGICTLHGKVVDPDAPACSDFIPRGWAFKEHITPGHHRKE
jgi:hypothetical protein